MGLIQNNYLKWTLSGLLLGIGFVAPALWILGLLGGIYFLLILSEEKHFLHQCLGVILAWTIKSACAISIFWSAYPVEWLPVELSSMQIFFIFIYWFTSSLWLGLGVIVLVAGFWLAKKYLYSANKYLPLILLPILWVISEAAGSFIFSLMMMGPGGTLNFAYSLGYSGYLLAEHDLLLQLARLGGVYSLGTIFGIISVLTLVLIQNKKTTLLQVLGILGVLIYISSFHNYYSLSDVAEGEGYRIASIDTYPSRELSQREKETEKKTAVTEAMTAALSLGGDYIILPEDADFFNQSQSAGLAKFNINLKYNNPRQIILDSGGVVINGKKVFQAMVFNGQGGEVQRVHKGYLVPQGEFMPNVYSKLFGLFDGGQLTAVISENLAFEVGPQVSQVNLDDGVPGVLFCFESVDPYGVRRLVKERPGLPFVAHPVSHAWFHDSEILWHQLDTMLKVQAVWNQKYIVSASNLANSKVYSPRGVKEIIPVSIKGEGWVVREIIIPKS